MSYCARERERECEKTILAMLKSMVKWRKKKNQNITFFETTQLYVSNLFERVTPRASSRPSSLFLADFLFLYRENDTRKFFFSISIEHVYHITRESKVFLLLETNGTLENRSFRCRNSWHKFRRERKIEAYPPFVVFANDPIMNCHGDRRMGHIVHWEARFLDFCFFKSKERQTRQIREASWLALIKRTVEKTILHD